MQTTLNTPTPAARAAAQALAAAADDTGGWDEMWTRYANAEQAVDAWCEADDGEGDPIPSAMLDERDEARADVLDATPPHWAALGQKARLLSYHLDDEPDPATVADPANSGVAAWWGRLIVQCEAIGAGDPDAADYLDVLKACGAAEAIAREALTDTANGYPAYGMSAGGVAEMAAIICAVQSDARTLANGSGAGAIAIDAVWCDGDSAARIRSILHARTAKPGEHHAERAATPEERGTGPDLRPQLAAMGALRTANAREQGAA